MTLIKFINYNDWIDTINDVISCCHHGFKNSHYDLDNFSYYFFNFLKEWSTLKSNALGFTFDCSPIKNQRNLPIFFINKNNKEHDIIVYFIAGSYNSAFSQAYFIACLDAWATAVHAELPKATDNIYFSLPRFTY